jgi:hypothetical protein
MLQRFISEQYGVKAFKYDHVNCPDKTKPLGVFFLWWVFRLVASPFCLEGIGLKFISNAVLYPRLRVKLTGERKTKSEPVLMKC